ncbi:MAG: zinc-ribbon domain-containing protein [Clostridia bacterium]|nr:zinc-ribbon domain-containing protein [Clostridia bacterium]
MKFCSNCGKQVDENAVVCVSCGHALSGSAAQRRSGEDAPNMGFVILGFFIPIVGLILWLMWRNDYPLKAKSCGKGALIGFVTNIAFTVLYIILYIVVLIPAMGMYF